MTAPKTHELILPPPDPTNPKIFPNTKERYKFYYELWKRSGGYQSAVTNLKGLTASVKELNTLTGIRTDDTVQGQINLKADITSLGTIASQDSDNVSISGGTISATTLERNDITIQAGTSGEDLPIGGSLTTNVTAVGNAGAGEDNLIVYEMPANVLSADNYYLDISAWGAVAANANNKTIKLKLGATTLITTGAVAANTGSWWITAQVIRTGAATEKAITRIISDNALILDSANYTAPAENTAAAINILCTGEGTNDDDIVQQGLIIKWFKA